MNHFTFSGIKSGMRIGACGVFLLYGNLVPFMIAFIIAEIVGVLEELV